MRLIYKAKSKWEEKPKFTPEDLKNTSINSHRTTYSDFWKEYAWKIQIRYFITPILQEKMYQSGKSHVWECGEVKAHHSHIFYLCSKLKQFWSINIGIMKDLFDVDNSTLYTSTFCSPWPMPPRDDVITSLDPDN